MALIISLTLGVFKYSEVETRFDKYLEKLRSSKFECVNLPIEQKKLLKQLVTVIGSIELHSASK